jgi:hypothetical protein
VGGSNYGLNIRSGEKKRRSLFAVVLSTTLLLLLLLLCCRTCRLFPAVQAYLLLVAALAAEEEALHLIRFIIPQGNHLALSLSLAAAFCAGERDYPFSLVKAIERRATRYGAEIFALFIFFVAIVIHEANEQQLHK